MRGPLDVNEEVVFGTVADGVGSMGPNDGLPASSNTTPAATSMLPPDHFLAATLATETSNQPSGSTRSGLTGAVRGRVSNEDLGGSAARGMNGTSGTFLSNVARAVSALPAAVEGMVTRVQTEVPKGQMVSPADPDGYISAHSGSPAEPRRPPSERSIPQTSSL